MKKIVVIVLFGFLTAQAEEISKQQQAKQTALGIIASLTDTIATLIINKHYTKDPNVTKTCCVDLVTQLADALAIAIVAKMEETKKEQKDVRSISLHEHDVDINQLAQELADKVIGQLE